MKMRQGHNGNWYIADEGKHFVLTQKGKVECASYRNKETGKPVSEYDTEEPYWSVEKGYVEEVPIPDWVETVGYEVVYNYKNSTLCCGNPIIFPEREIAEKYKRNWSKKPWFNETPYIKESVYKGRKLKPCNIHNGKPVYNMSWYYGIDALEIGDYVESEIVEELLDAVPPVCMKDTCSQIGEPANHKIDDKGKVRPTYETFKRISKDVWEYCGDCFAGENIRKGKEISCVNGL